MHTIRLIFILLLMASLARSQEIPALEVRAMNVSELKAYISREDGITYVVNFWATWCAPCVKELPYFEEFNAKYAPGEARVILVSLDFDNALESRVIPFLEKKGIRSEVIHLVEERSPNYWIPEISELWSGAIPATIFINSEKGIESFYEKSFHSTEELEELYKDLIR